MAYLGVRVELAPNNKQVGPGGKLPLDGTAPRCLRLYATAARWVWNWARWYREEHTEITAAGKVKSPDPYKGLGKVLTAWTKEDGGPRWLREVPSSVRDHALKDLSEAYSHFFRRCKEGAREKGYPKPRRWEPGHDSFTLAAPKNARVLPHGIDVTGLGVILSKHPIDLPPGGRVVTVGIREQAGGRWFASLQVEVAEGIQEPGPDWVAGSKPLPVIGVDWGCKDDSFLTFSTGERIPASKPYRAALAKLRRLEKEKSRRVKGSANRRETVRKIQAAHYEVTCQREAFLGELTRAMAGRKAVWVVETLDHTGMRAAGGAYKKGLNRSLSDVAGGRFQALLLEKCARYGALCVVAPTRYPSTQLCASCGYRREGEERLGLEDRVYVCPSCGHTADRDLNAAVNLRQWYLSAVPGAWVC